MHEGSILYFILNPEFLFVNVPCYFVSQINKDDCWEVVFIIGRQCECGLRH